MFAFSQKRELQVAVHYRVLTTTRRNPMGHSLSNHPGRQSLAGDDCSHGDESLAPS